MWYLALSSIVISAVRQQQIRSQEDGSFSVALLPTELDS